MRASSQSLWPQLAVSCKRGASAPQSWTPCRSFSERLAAAQSPLQALAKEQCLEALLQLQRQSAL